MMDLYEQHKKFFSARRWYQQDEARCETKVVIGGVVHRCECVVNHGSECAFSSTGRLAGVQDFALPVVKRAEVLV
jgi:hypothetical protein